MLHNVLATPHLGHWGTIGCLRHENKQSISGLPLSVTSDFGDLIISIVNHHESKSLTAGFCVADGREEPSKSNI